MEAGRTVTQMNTSLSASYKPYLAALGHLNRGAEATVARGRLLQLEPEFSIEQFLATTPLERESDKAHYAEGLRLAGIPEHLGEQLVAGRGIQVQRTSARAILIQAGPDLSAMDPSAMDPSAMVLSAMVLPARGRQTGDRSTREPEPRGRVIRGRTSSRLPASRHGNSRTGDSRTGDSRTGDARTGDTRPGERRHVDFVSRAG